MISVYKNKLQIEREGESIHGCTDLYRLIVHIFKGKFQLGKHTHRDVGICIYFHILIKFTLSSPLTKRIHVQYIVQ